jgi:hypothetical protein
VVDVEAHMGSAVDRVTAHNSGNWFFHLSQADAYVGGMTRYLKLK